MGQTWENLLFAHWAVEPAELRRLLPTGLPLDVRDGKAWLGITPFKVVGLRLRGLLPFPVVSNFLELNVRTYVTLDGKPGIWFFSLDAGSPLAVEAARRAYRLPYFRADMTARAFGSRIEYVSSRVEADAVPATFSGTYEARGPEFNAAADTLEYFLTERYCLYAEHEGQLFRAEIHHAPWPLREAELQLQLNSMPPPGVELPDEDPHLLLAPRQDVVIWPLEQVGRAANGQR